MLKALFKKILALLPRNRALELGRHILTQHDPDYLAVRDLILSGGHTNQNWLSGIGGQSYLLYGLVRAFRPKTIVEIGSARGLSACTMALACRHNNYGKVVAIDPHDLNDWTDSCQENNEQLEFFKTRIEEYNLGKYCQIFQGSSAQAAADWNQSVDLLFIDGDHSYQGVQRDFELFRKWMSPRSLVLFHDSGWEFSRGSKWYRSDLGVPKYLSELKQSGFQSITVLDEAGLTILDPTIGGIDFLNLGNS